VLHHHRQPLRPSNPLTSLLPHDVYGALVGTIDGPLGAGNANHVFIPIRVATGPCTGRYQLAFNTESTDLSQVQYCIRDEAITLTDVPSVGFTDDASVSYAALGLDQKDFTTVANGKLRTIVDDSAQDSDLIAAYGVTYSDGTGMQDLHFNNGEPTGSGHGDHPNQDGALALYALDRMGRNTRRWIFIKFQTQSLP
jgi:Uncharacterized conserved protein (DUF2278)